jgi:large subunit ribosomal protein L35
MHCFSAVLTFCQVQTKIKPKKSAVKRFKVTSTGKLLHARSGKQHLAVKKSGATALPPPAISPSTVTFGVCRSLPYNVSQATTSVLFRAKRSSGKE